MDWVCIDVGTLQFILLLLLPSFTLPPSPPPPPPLPPPPPPFRALAMGNADIPQQRKKELLETVAWHFGCHADDVTVDMIQEATAINAK